MREKKVLITGGSGFIGTHISKKLLSRGGYALTIVDVVPPKVEGVIFVNSVFSDFEKVATALTDTDIVIHLAAMVGVDNCRNNPELVRKINYSDTKKFIDFCIEKKIKRFIFSSSSEIYGNSHRIPYVEVDRPEPISLYAKLKLEIEDYLKTKSTLMSIGIVRFFNVYGPMQRGDFVVSSFLKAAFDSQPIIIFGSGSQTRCFTYVTDAVEGLVRLMEYEGSKFEIVNIGNAKETSIKDLASLILDLVPGTKSEIAFQDYEQNGVRESFLEIDRRVPAVEKAKTLLNFEAKNDLQSGLEQIIKNYDQNSKRP